MNTCKPYFEYRLPVSGDRIEWFYIIFKIYSLVHLLNTIFNGWTFSNLSYFTINNSTTILGRYISKNAHEKTIWWNSRWGYIVVNMVNACTLPIIAGPHSRRLPSYPLDMLHTNYVYNILQASGYFHHYITIYHIVVSR